MWRLRAYLVLNFREHCEHEKAFGFLWIVRTCLRCTARVLKADPQISHRKERTLEWTAWKTAYRHNKHLFDQLQSIMTTASMVSDWDDIPIKICTCLQNCMVPCPLVVGGMRSSNLIWCINVYSDKDSSLLECDAVSLGEWLQMLWRPYDLSKHQEPCIQ
jgi:hypothetical protein